MAYGRGNVCSTDATNLLSVLLVGKSYFAENVRDDPVVPMPVEGSLLGNGKSRQDEGFHFYPPFGVKHLVVELLLLQAHLEVLRLKLNACSCQSFARPDELLRRKTLVFSEVNREVILTHSFRAS